MEVEVFKIGSLVSLSGIKAIVTGITIRSNNFVTYECSWWDNNTHNCKWFDSIEVEKREESLVGKVGFK